jgi:hypothetical protein
VDKAALLGLDCAVSDLFFDHGGVLVSTWALTCKEHAGAYEDLVKNVQTVAGEPNYALAA